jgi:AraC-like DNA-binding protein
MRFTQGEVLIRAAPVTNGSIATLTSTIPLAMGEGVAIPQLLAAFQTVTGLGVRVTRPADDSPIWACENPFCHRLRLCYAAIAPCRALRCQVSNETEMKLRVRRCPSGLEHVTLPVLAPSGWVVWIESGQILLNPPRPEDFGVIRRRLNLSPSADAELESSFFATPVLTRNRLEAAIRLLPMIARELELTMVRPPDPELLPSEDPVDMAKRRIVQRLGDPIRLSQLAAETGVSGAYLSRLFHRRTGQTVTEFVACARIEQAKRFLAQGWRIADAAYAAGFQSLRQFNDRFKAHTRETPTQYRQACLSPINVSFPPRQPTPDGVRASHAP